MKNLIIPTILFFAAVLMVTACGGAESNSNEPCSIFGVISDNVTSAHIKNATVELKDSEEKLVAASNTGSEGNYIFDGLAAGSYTLSVKSDGYYPKTMSVIVEADKENKYDVSLEKTPPELRILDDSGKDIDELDFGEKVDVISLHFNIWNMGGQNLDWEIDFSATWITSVSQRFGALPFREMQAVIVYIDRDLLNEKKAETYIHINSNNGNKQLLVKATIINGITRQADCEGKPEENAQWNTVDTITQTWNDTDSEWEPSNISVYETEPSNKECRFKCFESYFWNGKQCVDPCKSAPCVDKEHSTEKCIGKTADKYACECEKSFAWDENSLQCLNPCYPNPCIDKENSTGVCEKDKENPFTGYFCGCLLNYTFDPDDKQCLPDKKKAECSGLPVNAEWWNGVSSITQTWSGSEWLPTTVGVYSETANPTECRYKCKTNYNWENSQCVAATQKAGCSPKPANSVWNDNGENGMFMQEWDGEQWNPPSHTSSESATAGVCRFKCNEDYHFENSKCVYKIRESDCSGLPNGAEWNTATSITQEWDGNEWLPTTTGSYDTNPSTEECKFKCKIHYTWNNTICKADSQDSPCTGRPENAEWNTASTITQTWNGASWQPTITASYNTVASTKECRFKCVEDYFWNGSACLDPCGSDPCGEIEHSTACVGINANEYSCECEDAFEWSGTRCRKIGEPCTGQTKCYNNLTELSCPSSGTFVGQDAQYAAGGTCLNRSFTIDDSYSGQKTVIDNNTDLEWAQLVPTSKYTRTAAKKYCDDSDYGGHEDWRLPTPKELLTIVDNGKVAPAVDPSFFPNHSNDRFWTSMLYAEDSGKAWFIDFGSGYAEKIETSKSYYVSCVRGESLRNNFVKSTECSENIVSDKETGLVWTATYVERKKWEEALSYCENLTYACHGDWRLPNKNELVSLLDHEEREPSTTFPDMPIVNFWTSTSSEGNRNRAWYVGFSYGNVYETLKTTDNPMYVRCVRNF